MPACVVASVLAWPSIDWVSTHHNLPLHSSRTSSTQGGMLAVCKWPLLLWCCLDRSQPPKSCTFAYTARCCTCILTRVYPIGDPLPALVFKSWPIALGGCVCTCTHLAAGWAAMHAPLERESRECTICCAVLLVRTSACNSLWVPAYCSILERFVWLLCRVGFF